MKVAALLPELPRKQNKQPKNVHRSMKYFGLHMIIKELEKKWGIKVEFADYKNVNKFDVVLVSIHSIEDIYNVIYTTEIIMKGKKKGIWIAGGAGISNIEPIKEIFDYIVLGRGEQAIHEIILQLKHGSQLHNTGIYNKITHTTTTTYQLNYAQQLYKGEVSGRTETMYGCKYNCFYCRYRYSSLPPTKRKLDNKTTMPGNEETFWELEIKDGRQYTTSIDGLTEATRFRVNKKITNQSIIQKLVNIPKFKTPA